MSATSGNVRFNGLRAQETVVFFGNNLGAECQRCGAFAQTSSGHRYCAHIACPIALREFKRRKRKRTSSLERVYLPRALELRRDLRDADASANAEAEGKAEV